MKSITVYSISFAISLLLSRIYEKKAIRWYNKKYFSSWVLLFISISPVVFIATIRYGIGTDYFGYVGVYNYIAERFNISLIFEFYQEPLNVVLYYLSYLIFNNEAGMFFIYSFITMIFTIYGIKNFCKVLSIPFALFIYFMTQYHLSYNGMRQMLAVSIIFFAYKYILERKFLQYLKYVILASLFHKSAMFMIALYFLCFTLENASSKIKNKFFYFGILLTPIIAPIINKVLPKLASLLGMYEKYIGSEGQKNVYFLLYVIPPLFVVIFYRKKLLKINYKYEFFIKLLFLQIPFQYMGFYVAYFDRLAVYASASQIILFPVIIRSISNKKERYILAYCMILWYLFYYTIMFIFLKSNEVYPYQSILQ